ncbi:transmembrane protein 135-like isoform X1 [Lytechinus pictus]|uniref:transmembrane protein 135-like isoform X1 n=1 Tax=Lytechinus pictus TaxID=7653 RepID=UPI0030B9C90D
MAEMSRFWQQCTCYEFLHCWSPSCSGAVFSIVNAVTKYSFRMHAIFYVVSHTYGRLKKKQRLTWSRLVPFFCDVFQSTLFLTSNVSMVISAFCVFRHLFGGFYTGFGFISSFPACFIAILTERKSRRSMLALYTMNLAMEVVFNMCKQRNYVTPVKNGEVMIFAAASAIIFCMLR